MGNNNASNFIRNVRENNNNARKYSRLKEYNFGVGKYLGILFLAFTGIKAVSDGIVDYINNRDRNNNNNNDFNRRRRC